MSRTRSTISCWSVLFMLCLGTSPAVAFEVETVELELEGEPGKQVAAEQLKLTSALRLVSDGQTIWSKERPGPYIYDGLRQASRLNGSSLALGAGDQIVLDSKLLKLHGDSSLTIELFVKPNAIPRQTITLAGKQSETKDGAEISLRVKRLHNHNQSYWGAAYKSGGQQREEWTAGHYVTIARMRPDALDWRHLAIVYDAERRTVTSYVDHWLASSRRLEQSLRWDDGPVVIAAAANKRARFDGLIDDVRVTAAALQPAQFLRSVSEPLSDVDFGSPETVLPSSSGYVDVRASFGAVGDGKHDDTAAFQRAFQSLANKRPGAYYTLYVPPGEYLVSDMLHCSRFIVVQGGGRERTKIRLKDHCNGFQDAANPRPVIRASSTSAAPGSNRGVNGSSIGIYFADLTIDVGASNPGAKGLEYHSNNHGSLERVDILSRNGEGVVALDLSHKTVGPSLIRDVRLTGFDYGVIIKYAEYSMTLEHVEMSGQRKAGILNQGNILAIRKLLSRNKAPAIVSEGAGSMVTLLDSQLVGGAEDNIAIDAEGALYVRNVDVDGYSTSIRKRVFEWYGWKAKPAFAWKDGPLVKGDIDEWWGDRVTAPFGGKQSGSLKLPIEETPQAPQLSADQWANVADYAHLVTEDDWTAAIQSAIDSGKPGLILPQNGYTVRGSISLRGKLQRIHGMRSALRRSREADASQPVMIVDFKDPDHSLVIEHLAIGGQLHHRSPATLTLRHSNPVEYTTAAGVGKLFLEGVQTDGWKFNHPQKIWCRQWNPEAHGDGPVIESRGATIWSLGFKTEYESSKLWAFDGAKTEILGGFIYPVRKNIPLDRPVFKHVDSDFTGIWGMSVYVANHKLQVDDTRDGERKTTTTDDGGWARSRYRMDLYTNAKAK